ncbi:stromal cell-derived factor 2 [Platysternon megacephalum]|uniref:Stromal cell-derived factor 2 n=1 Tax=Platysternon megacephalum TaxID=55544 RepID=A0A4D9E097_9SAUR|nr:stromal cell-derived factor 2 [Platysternon megacephalum]
MFLCPQPCAGVRTCILGLLLAAEGVGMRWGGGGECQKPTADARDLLCLGATTMAGSTRGSVPLSHHPRELTKQHAVDNSQCANGESEAEQTASRRQNWEQNPGVTPAPPNHYTRLYSIRNQLLI